MIIYRNRKPKTKKEDKAYIYTNHRGEIFNDVETLEKIKKMAIPPAYERVKIDTSPCAKIVYEGYDDKNRLQQIYSKEHTKKAKKDKFCRLIGFGKVLPKLQFDIQKYIEAERISQNKIIAIILQIIWKCGFRVGNSKYEKLYESYGVSNIMKSHITFSGKKATIQFKGKKSVINKCDIVDKKIVKELVDLTRNKAPKDYVFMYKKDGKFELVKPSEINKWLKKYGNITSKDLRTFDTNILFIKSIKNMEKELFEATSVAKRKKIAKKALEYASSHINNTPGICKSSYLLTEIYIMCVENPKKYKKHFLSKVQARIAFINYLKIYCNPKSTKNPKSTGKSKKEKN